MCGIAFAIRSSSSYHVTGASPPTGITLLDSPAASSSTNGDPGSGANANGNASTAAERARTSFTPDDSTTTPSSSASERAGYGMPFPDGSMAEVWLDANESWQTLTNAVAPRGPDWQASYIKHVRVKKKFHFELRFYASILHMRGEQLQRQPFVAPNGDIFLFSGEVFDGLEIGSNENDGRKLFQRILDQGPSLFFGSIRDIEGPYAFVYYQAANHRVYFARDPLGRRSLLMHPPTPISPSLFLVSNAPGVDYPLHDFEDVACDSVHCYHLLDLKGKSWLVDGKRGLSSYPRYPKSMGLSQDILIYPFDQIRTALPQASNLLPRDMSGAPVVTPDLHLTIQAFLKQLESSIRKRVTNIPRQLGSLPTQARVAVLFSGGLDCTTLALLADKFVPADDAIDLLNVAFENPRAIDAKRRQAAARRPGGRAGAGGGGGLGVRQNSDASSTATISANARASSSSSNGDKGKQRASSNHDDAGAMMDLDDLSSGQQSRNGLATPAESVGDDGEVHGARELPEFMDDYLDSHSSSGAAAAATLPPDPSVYAVPDRLSGLASYRELRALRPGRRWNFVAVDVPYSEMVRERPKVIELMRPSKTVMDLSIAIAFYFAARGKGVIDDDSGSQQPYTSTARVLLSGLGADELMGGYSRHRKAFGDGDWRALINELQVDIDRLPTRNLGRDDRIISHHGKEVRYPFLAGSVVDFCARTPVWMKCDMRFPEGVGDKLLLRALARGLGLKDSAALRKRAIQFGAKSAKLEPDASGVRGTDDVAV